MSREGFWMTSQRREGIGLEQSFQTRFRATLCFELRNGGIVDFQHPIPALRFLKSLEPEGEKEALVFGTEGLKKTCRLIPFLIPFKSLTPGPDGLGRKRLL